jgi:hypothetical protein
MQISTVITNAQPRVVTPRNGSQPFTVYEIFDHEGTAWRVKDDVYNQAIHWIGQTVDAIVRVEQNGQWTNRFADLVQLSSGPPLAIPQQPAAGVAVAQAMQAAQQTGRIQPTMPQGPSQPTQIPAPISTFPTEKDLSINRQTAAKVSALISGEDAGAFWQNCVELSRYFDSGVTPSMAGMITGGAGVADSDMDIPFTTTIDGIQ